MPTPVEIQTAQPTSSCAACHTLAHEVQVARQAALDEAKRMFQGPVSAQGVPMAVVRESYGQGPKIRHVHSPTDIKWVFPLHEQLEPQFYAGPEAGKTPADLHAIRARVPKWTDKTFKDVVPGDAQSTITVVLENYSLQYVHLKEAATWILNAVQWFDVLEHPMMVFTWRKDWEGASKFQYLVQILQANLQDYIPNWQIFVKKLETVDKKVKEWQFPTTIWTGTPVIVFMAETDFDNLQVVGFKHVNPMWSFPSTSVGQDWNPITFGMPAWHLKEDPEHSQDALVSQSPFAVFKASTSSSLWVSLPARLFLQVQTSNVARRIAHTVHRRGMEHIHMMLQHFTVISFKWKEPVLSFVITAF